MGGVGVGDQSFAGGFGYGGLAGGVEFGFFEVFEDFLGAGDDRVWEAGESGDLDAVALVCAAGEDFSQEDDLVVPLADGDIEILHAAAGALEVGEFVVVGGEEGAAADFVVEVFGDAPGDGEAVECGCAASDFIEDDEAAVRGVIEDVRRFVHFHHEGRLTSREVVVGADAGEDAVGEAESHGFGGDETAGLGKEGEEGDLADVGGFSSHVRAGDDGEFLPVRAKVCVIRNKARAFGLLVQDGVASIADFQNIRVVDLRAAVAVEACGFGERADGVKDGECRGGFLQVVDLAQDGAAEFGEDFDLAGAGAFVRAEDFAFKFLEFGSDEALAVDGCLFADVVGWDRAEVRFGDFDEVAEDGSEADLEGFDARPLDFLFLQGGDPVFSLVRGRAEFVQVRVVACLDEAAITNHCGRFRYDGAAEGFTEFRKGMEACGETREQGGGNGESMKPSKTGREGGDAVEGLRQG